MWARKKQEAAVKPEVAASNLFHACKFFFEIFDAICCEEEKRRGTCFNNQMIAADGK